MRWRRILQRHGMDTDELADGWDADPFDMLARGCDPVHATISFSAKANNPDYGITGVQVHVSMMCPQDERSMNLAAELCFRKVIELLNPAAASIGVPQLPTMPE
jgi:hypothetical protein